MDNQLLVQNPIFVDKNFQMLSFVKLNRNS